MIQPWWLVGMRSSSARDGLWKFGRREALLSLHWSSFAFWFPSPFLMFHVVFCQCRSLSFLFLHVCCADADPFSILCGARTREAPTYLAGASSEIQSANHLKAQII